MAKLTINTSNKQFPTAASLYGLFFEDINRSGDGGLYPELLRNRTFDDSICPDDLIPDGDDFKNVEGWPFEYQKGEGHKNWREKVPSTDIPAWYAKKATMTLDRADTLNENRAAALAVCFQNGGSVYNIGFSGVAVHEGEAYKVSFFAKAEAPTPLIFSIETDRGTLCSKMLCVRTVGYVFHELILIPDATEKESRFCISAPEGGEVKFGYVSLMPTDTYKGHGLRRDLCEKLEALKPAFLRFPGGCIVEGFSKSTVQRFKRMVGAPWERPGVLNLWGYRSTEGLGFHEYLQLCEDLDTDGLYVCNCGMTCQARHCILLDDEEITDLLDDVLAALEYALGSKDTTYWGALRAKAGHPEPFRLKYLEIGNENNGEEYERRYEIFRRAITEKYPELIIIANTHVEESGLPLDIADEHFYNRVEWFAENVHFYDKYDRKGPGIFIGEYAVVAGNIRTLYAAIGEAMFLIGAERNQDVVKLSSYAPLFENVNYAAWEPDLIAFDGLHNYAIPSYYVQRMFGQNRGSYVVESTQECDVLYAPYLKGGPCLLGDEGVRFKNARWNGEEIFPTHEMFGNVYDCGEGIYSTRNMYSEEEAERAERFGMKGSVMIVMGDDEEAKKGVFEIELFAEEGKELGVGMFTTPYGKARNSADSPWNLFTVQPVRFMIKDGKGSLFSGGGFHKQKLCELFDVDCEEGRFHLVRLESDGETVTCSVDGRVVAEARLPHYDKISSVVTEDEENVIIKVANIDESDINLEIRLDCDVLGDYEADVLAGEPASVNTMETPTVLEDRRVIYTGADRMFTHVVPASSVSVIRLKKK